MRNVVIGLIIGLVVGVVLGVTILTPKLKIHAASKSVLSERDLEKTITAEPTPVLSSLHLGDTIHWRSAPPFPSDRPNVTTLAKEYAQQLAVLSSDKIILPVLPAKEVISANSLFGAIASGRIDALFATADIGVHKEPALALFSAIPFGPSPSDVLSWIEGGNGEEKLKELFNTHNIEPLVCGYMPPESSGWYRNEFTNVEALKDMHIRISGLGAKVMEKSGVTVVNIPPEKILGAFDQDQLDGAVFSSPAVDAKAGFSRFAKNYYFPGWQNQGHPLLLLINNRAWKRLDQERQALLKAACDQHTTRSFAKAAEKQYHGLRDITKQEVNLKRMPSYILTELRKSWKTVLSEEARRNQDFRETWEDLNSFLQTQRLWQEMGHIKTERDNNFVSEPMTAQ
jgi:TRAP-type mannitol/chloroaromatic compound transport system substrate-binding protein